MSTYQDNPMNSVQFGKPANYVSLNAYTPSLGVPIISNVTANGNYVFKQQDKYQMIPYFNGVDYQNPNYNSLTLGSGCNNYPGVNQGYDTDKCGDDCVRYYKSDCPQSIRPDVPKPPCVPSGPPVPPGPPPYGPVLAGSRRR
jgi:hypothetical protein